MNLLRRFAAMKTTVNEMGERPTKSKKNDDMKYFSINELARTDTRLPNMPSPEEAANLEHLIDAVLDPAREAMGCPIRINSGYRSPAVNKKVGGASTSQHVRGEAADLDTTDNAKLFSWIRANVDFDQLIWEFGTDRSPDWVHVSIKRSGINRKSVLRAKKASGTTIYVKL